MNPKPAKRTLTGVLLAGGRSERMGRNKALLNYQNRPLWQVQVAKLEYLSGLFEQSSADAGVVPVQDGFYAGHCAIYPPGIRNLAEEVLQSEDRSFQHLIRRAITQNLLTPLPVLDAERSLFTNWNTLESLDLARESHPH